jgi:hypothetical protein
MNFKTAAGPPSWVVLGLFRKSLSVFMSFKPLAFTGWAFRAAKKSFLGIAFRRDRARLRLLVGGLSSAKGKRECHGKSRYEIETEQSAPNAG